VGRVRRGGTFVGTFVGTVQGGGTFVGTFVGTVQGGGTFVGTVRRGGRENVYSTRVCAWKHDGGMRTSSSTRGHTG
jgi:hypothetical protein